LIQVLLPLDKTGMVKMLAQTQKEVLQFFGFKTPNELFWNRQFTDNALDETTRSYNKAITVFDKTFLKPYDKAGRT
jgi:hypothetical protein